MLKDKSPPNVTVQPTAGGAGSTGVGVRPFPPLGPFHSPYGFAGFPAALDPALFYGMGRDFLLHAQLQQLARQHHQQQQQSSTTPAFPPQLKLTASTPTTSAASSTSSTSVKAEPPSDPSPSTAAPTPPVTKPTTKPSSSFHVQNLIWFMTHYEAIQPKIFLNINDLQTYYLGTKT